ncbi:hypothetical protein, partial [Ciceribacter selenitireducens]|uniref:hypothetical protein n=1 Tax=Ciceribacter selenitireducens TaxID=448181 RepID=UPI001AECDF90
SSRQTIQSGNPSASQPISRRFLMNERLRRQQRRRPRSVSGVINSPPETSQQPFVKKLSFFSSH